MPPVSFDAASNSGLQTAQSGYSWNHTNAGNFLAVDLSLLSVPGTTVTGVTYNGVPLTRITSQYSATAIGGVECWGLVLPPVGTFSIAVTLSASCISAGCAASYFWVDTNAPTDSPNSASATNVGAADAAVVITPTSDRSWPHAVVACNDGSISVALGTGRNLVTDGLTVSGGDLDSGAQVSPAAPTTLSYTGVGAGVTWAMAGYALRRMAWCHVVTTDGMLF